MCEGVLVVVDAKAVVFTRIWCGFEQATAVRHAKLLLDFATVHGGTAQLLTERFAYENEGRQRKAARERGFPLELMEKGYTLDITKAEASREEDKRNILNGLDRKDLKAEPDLASPTFTRINNALRSMLAAASVLKSAEAGRLESAIAVATAGKTPEDAFACLNDLGLLLQDMGKLEDAGPLFRRALEGREAKLGADHPDTLSSVNNLGALLKVMGNPEAAEPLLRRSAQA